MQRFPDGSARFPRVEKTRAQLPRVNPPSSLVVVEGETPGLFHSLPRASLPRVERSGRISPARLSLTTGPRRRRCWERLLRPAELLPPAIGARAPPVSAFSRPRVSCTRPPSSFLRPHLRLLQDLGRLKLFYHGTGNRSSSVPHLPTNGNTQLLKIHSPATSTSHTISDAVSHHYLHLVLILLAVMFFLRYSVYVISLMISLCTNSLYCWG
jgi:hypothetical protein